MFKTENKQRISEAKKVNTEALFGAIDLFKKDVKAVLEGQVYLNKEEFLELEKGYENKAIDYFAINCSAGDPQFRKEFVLEFELKLIESKKDFREQNQTNCEKVVAKTEKLVTASINQSNQQMNEIFESFASVDQMSGNHTLIRQQCLDHFSEECVYKDQQFLSKYLDQFDNDINKSFEVLKTKLIERQEKLQNSLNSQIIEAKEYYIQVIYLMNILWFL